MRKVNVNCIIVDQSLIHVQQFATLWSMSGFPVLHYILECAQTHVHWASDAIQISHPLPSSSPPSFNLSQHQGLFLLSVLPIRWPNYWSFSFSIRPFKWYSGLISLRTDWFDLLVRDSQESSPAPQFKSIILWHSAFFMVQLSHPYKTTGKNRALTIETFASKVTLCFLKCYLGCS